MKTILIVTNLCIIFSLALAQYKKYFVTVSTSSSDIPTKLGISLMYYKTSGGMDPIQKWSDRRKLDVCMDIFNSRFFITNDDYDEYENILKEVRAVAEKYASSYTGLIKKEIFIKYKSFELINLSSFVSPCYLYRNIELYISTDFTNTNSFFLYSYIPESSDMSESSRVTLLAYAELNPRSDSRTKYELELLYFTQRNVLDENNNFIKREPEPWSPRSLRVCAAGYEYIAKDMDLSLEISRVTFFDVHMQSIKITATQPTRYYKLPVLLCQVHSMYTNTTANYYFTPDLENNSSVFYLSTNGSFLNIEKCISGVP